MSTFRDLEKHWRCVVPPAAEPIHRDEAKAQCNLLPEQTDWDADFDRWIQAAREELEDGAQLALVTQTWELVLRRFPCGGEPIELWRPPVQAVVSVMYRDVAGEMTELEEFRSSLDLYPAMLEPLAGQSWPATDGSYGAVVIRFRTGSATPAQVDLENSALAPSPQHFVDDAAVRLSVSGGNFPDGLWPRTSYYVVGAESDAIQLATAEGGEAVTLSGAGSGQLFVGEVPARAARAIRMMVAHNFKQREAALTKEQDQAFWSLVMGLKWKD